MVSGEKERQGDLQSLGWGRNPIDVTQQCRTGRSHQSPEAGVALPGNPGFMSTEDFLSFSSREKRRFLRIG
jgi:hypothetical protein